MLVTLTQFDGNLISMDANAVRVVRQLTMEERGKAIKDGKAGVATNVNLETPQGLIGFNVVEAADTVICAVNQAMTAAH